MLLTPGALIRPRLLCRELHFFFFVCAFFFLSSFVVQYKDTYVHGPSRQTEKKGKSEERIKNEKKKVHNTGRKLNSHKNSFKSRQSTSLEKLKERNYTIKEPTIHPK